MISIVMAYYNRKELLLNTLKTIKDDVELVIIDDCSQEPLELPNARVIRPINKWWINPCIPFNLGFRHAKGDIIIIQNPECRHIGNVVEYVEQNLKPGDYFSFACKSLTENGEFNMWYNHSEHQPRGLHFCSAIYKEDLFKKMNGGFDERFSQGYCYDDDEFAFRAKKNLNFKIIDEPFVEHQWHPKYNHDWDLTVKNEKIFKNLTK